MNRLAYTGIVGGAIALAVLVFVLFGGRNEEPATAPDAARP